MAGQVGHFGKRDTIPVVFRLTWWGLFFFQEQRLVEDSTREVKKVRKARNRRLEWNMMAYDKEFRPDNRFSPSPYHMASSEGSLSPDNRQVFRISRFAGSLGILCCVFLLHFGFQVRFDYYYYYFFWMLFLLTAGRIAFWLDAGSGRSRP